MQPISQLSKVGPTPKRYYEKYEFGDYLTRDRWNSYLIQLRKVLEIKPRSVLVVGIGDGLIPYYLEQQGLQVSTLDLDQDLKPVYQASIASPNQIQHIPPADVVVCCQVLEHLPFDQFEICLKNLRQLTGRRLVLSLPDVRKLLRFQIGLSGLGVWRLAIPFPYLKKEHEFNGEHYWEIGKKGYPLSRVLNEIVKVFGNTKATRNFDFPYHTFFVSDV